MDDTRLLLNSIILMMVVFLVGMTAQTVWTPAEQSTYYEKGVLDGKVAINDTEYTRCVSYVSIGEPNSNPFNYAVCTTSKAHQAQNSYMYCKGFVDGYAQQHIGSGIRGIE